MPFVLRDEIFHPVRRNYSSHKTDISVPQDKSSPPRKGNGEQTYNP
ncbi:hypothetical protein HMPREF9445_01780 [Bacteroides clarus YIT 12056]|uniref:Uncharacterized protein n=1 Tax=Bacteroides clarus YIT 12056 TaxID=762984 RepID=A0ABN0CNM4_9BACE|nr:hypothetical protein HMPREF9445_01780 [Bacteroides clarus YIT 12056]